MNKKSKVLCLFGLATMLFVASSSYAQTVSGDIPKTISYQGMITKDGKALADGEYSVTVKFFDKEQRGNLVWQSDHKASVVNGVVSLQIGSGSVPLPDAKEMDKALWVGLSINGESISQLTPLSSTPYALNIPDNSVTAKKMGTDYVSSILVDGKKVTGKSGVLNLKGGEGIKLEYDAATQSVSLNAPSLGISSEKGKGQDPLVHNGAADYWGESGNTLAGSQTSPPQWFGSSSNHDVIMKSGNSETMRLVSGATGGADRIKVSAGGSQVYSISANGFATATHNNGSGAVVQQGTYHKENSILAWGKIPAPLVNNPGPNAPMSTVKDFGVSAIVPPAWHNHACVVTLEAVPNVSYDDGSVTVTLVDDMDEPYPNPDGYGWPFSPGPSYIRPAFATVSRIVSTNPGGPMPVGGLAPNQFLVRTYGIATYAISSYDSRPEIVEWPFPFYFKVCSR